VGCSGGADCSNVGEELVAGSMHGVRGDQDPVGKRMHADYAGWRGL
jgi:hypothetical protein